MDQTTKRLNFQPEHRLMSRLRGWPFAETAHRAEPRRTSSGKTFSSLRADADVLRQLMAYHRGRMMVSIIAVLMVIAFLLTLLFMRYVSKVL